MQNLEEYDNQKKKEKLNYAFGIALFFLSLIIALAFLAVKVSADEIPEELAVHCILGEARGEGFSSMLGHAEALRARGTVKGVYGCKADISKEMSYLKAKDIISQAKMAWKESKYSNTVKGADHWGSLKVDGKWIAEMERKGFVRTATIKNTAFYRRGSL